MSLLGISEADYEDKLRRHYASDDSLLRSARYYLNPAITHAEKTLERLTQKETEWSFELAGREPANWLDFIFWPYDQKSIRKKVNELKNRSNFWSTYLDRLRAGRTAIESRDLHTTGTALKEASMYVPSTYRGLVTPDLLAGIDAMFMDNCADELLKRAHKNHY